MNLLSHLEKELKIDLRFLKYKQFTNCTGNGPIVLGVIFIVIGVFVSLSFLQHI